MAHRPEPETFAVSASGSARGATGRCSGRPRDSGGDARACRERPAGRLAQPSRTRAAAADGRPV